MRFPFLRSYNNDRLAVPHSSILTYLIDLMQKIITIKVLSLPLVSCQIYISFSGIDLVSVAPISNPKGMIKVFQNSALGVVNTKFCILHRPFFSYLKSLSFLKCVLSHDTGLYAQLTCVTLKLFHRHTHLDSFRSQ